LEHRTLTLTFVFTDIEGSTRLWEQFPAEMNAALEHHDTLMREIFTACEGTVFKTIGDAFCAVFANATAALRASVEIQHRILQETWELPQELRVRIALHTGEAEARDNDYFGPTLNRVARLLAAAHGGQVLITAATEELVSGNLPQGVLLRDLGEHRLRDLNRPERIFQIIHPELPSEFAALRGLESFSHNLPIQLTSFVGRKAEMDELSQLLSTTRLLTLTGAGGSGKTRIALQVAADHVEHYPDGVWLIELASLTDASLFWPAVASVLGVREEPGRPLRDTISEYLRSKAMMLLLDNCEHLIDACAQCADLLLKTCSNIHIVATSREPLGIPGEVVWRIPALSMPNPRQLPTGEELVPALLRYEAVNLFAERAIAAQHSFQLTPVNAQSVAEICYRLDGIPLAIELAAARVNVLTPEQISARLADRFRLLTGGSRTALPRQQTLRAAIEWSYELLAPEERTLFNRLAGFSGGFNLESAEIVCAGDGVEDWEVLDIVTRLVNKSLVTTEPEQDQVRYRLLETLRTYGSEQLTKSGETDAVRQRHLEHFLEFAQQGASLLMGPQQPVWLARIQTDYDNLRSALDWAMDYDPVTGLKLANALGRFWEIRGLWSEGRDWLERSLSLASVLPGDLRADALVAAGRLAWYQGDYEWARTLLTGGLGLHREAGDLRGTANALNNLGIIAYAQGQYKEASALYEECLAIWRELQDDMGIARALGNLGLIASEQGESAQAREFYAECLILFRKRGDRSGISKVLHNLGMVATAQGDYESAKNYYEESLEIKRELGDRFGIAITLGNLGNLVMHTGDMESSIALHHESLTIRRELGDKRGVAASLDSLGTLSHIQGDYQTARAFADESLDLRRELGDKPGIGMSLHHLGVIATSLGEYDHARKLYLESLQIREELGDKRGVADCLEGIASLEGAQGDYLKAARLYAASETLRESVGAPLHPDERASLETKLEAARRSVETEEFQEAWEEGKSMSLTQAVEYATGEAGIAAVSAS
jgi:predicted ATPase/class 3 adenylate cyclase